MCSGAVVIATIRFRSAGDAPTRLAGDLAAARFVSRPGERRVGTDHRCARSIGASDDACGPTASPGWLCCNRGTL